MPTITTTPAGQIVAANLQARRQAEAADARRAAREGLDELTAKRADTTTPLATVGNPPRLINEEPPAPKHSATFTIHALMDDFPFDVSFSGSADQLASTVQRLRDLGAVPPTQAARAAVEAEKERSAPVCKCDTCDRYGTPMKESTKRAGTWDCAGKIGMKSGQPVYCRETA